MSSPSSIDLFAFPDLVVRQIARNFDHISFVKFSLCSTTANQVAESVNIFRKPDCFTVEYDPKCSYAVFHLGCDKTRFGMELNDNSFTFFVWNGSEVVDEAAVDASQLSMFRGMFDRWSNEKAVFKLTAYLQKLFNYKAHLDLSGWAQAVWNIGEILDALPSLRGVTFAARNVSDEKYTELLYNNKCSHLQVNLCDDLSGTLKDLDVTKIKVKYFTARVANWITLDHLLDWDFIYIEANETRITSTDKNIFLTQWMNGMKPNARTLIIDAIEPLTVEVILRELDAELKSETKQLEPCHFSELESEKKKLYPDHFSELERFEELEGGYEIRSEDGATARIFFTNCKYRHSELYTTVTCYFWPPAENISV